MGQIIHAIGNTEELKMSVITAKDMVQRAHEIHATTPTVSAALGRTLLGASLLGNAMKEENGSLTLRISGDGPIKGIVCVSDSSGCVRGMVGDPTIELPLREDGKLNVGGAVGKNGLFTVTRDLGMGQPYVGSVELVSGEIAEDLTSYLLSSEQIPSACALGVLVDKDMSIRAAGGFLVQLLPNASDELITKLEDNIFLMDQVTTVLDEDSPEELFRQVLKGIDYHIESTDEVCYRCNCSRERVEETLAGISETDLQEIITDGKDIDVSCQFCDAVYTFTPQQLQEILMKSRD